MTIESVGYSGSLWDRGRTVIVESVDYSRSLCFYFCIGGSGEKVRAVIVESVGYSRSLCFCFCEL